MYKKVSIALVSALLAGVVVFSTCKKDEDDGVAAGKAAGKELCRCLADADGEDEIDKCIDDNTEKWYDKFFYSSGTIFEDAFINELENCDAYDIYMGRSGSW